MNLKFCFIRERMGRDETGSERESYSESERCRLLRAENLRFMEYFAEKNVERQISLLELQREELLEHVHREERKISCLDYLLYQIRKTTA